MTGQVGVYYAQFLVGNILILDDGTTEFTYTPEWINTPRAFPISVLMPLALDQYPNKIVGPWLANLLPEEQQLEALSRSLGLSKTDAIALLREIGGDTAGALSFDTPSLQENWEYIPLTEYYGEPNPEKALEAHFGELTERPFMAGADGVRLSLAGGQKKSALAVVDKGRQPVLRLPVESDLLAVPKNGAPSTVIIKPDNQRLPGIVENETYCLKLAQAIGIDAAEVSSLSIGKRSALCVLRFDRRVSRDGRIQRLHQEDFAQATATPPGRKYEVGSVPGFKLDDLFSVKSHLEPRDVLNLFDQFAFNVLVANTDAHAKNYSILHRLGPSVELSPLYDVSTVLPWPHVNQYFAQKIGNRKRKPSDMKPSHFESIATDLGFRPTEVINRVTRIVDLMIEHRPSVEKAVCELPGTAQGYVKEAAARTEENALRILGRIPNG
jgi:serine/threonine-protein kinase HipA